MTVLDSIGLIIPDPRLTLDAISAADSSYTQAGPRPGVPTTTSTTAAALEASGTMAADEVLEVRTLLGGFATAGLRAASFLWRPGTTGDYMGHDTPVCFRDWDWVTRRANGGTQSNSRPHALTLQSGRVIVAAHRSGGAARWCEVFWRDPNDTTWSAGVTVDEELADASHPALLQLPSGRVLCYAWANQGADSQVLHVSASDDDGATWSLMSTAACPAIATDAVNGYVCGRIRPVYSAGSVLVFISLQWRATSEYVLWQLASDAAGYQLDSIAIGDPTEAADRGRCGTPIVTDTGQWVLYYYAVTAAEWSYKVLASPWASHLDATRVASGWLSGSAGIDLGPDELALFRDSAGTWRALLLTDDPAVLAWTMVYSRSGLAPWYNPQIRTGFGNADASLTQLTACDQRGTMIAVGIPSTLVQAFDADSLLSVLCGGPSTLTWPSLSGLDVLQRGVGMPQMVGIEDVAGQGWTASTTGAPTESYVAGGVTIVQGSSDARGYTLATGTTTAIVAVDEVFLTVASGGSLALDSCIFGRRIADGVNDCDVAVRFTTTGIRVIDRNTGGTLDSASVATNGGIRVRVHLSLGLVSVWYAVPAAAGGHPLTWTLAYSGAISNNTAFPNGTGARFFGATAAGVGWNVSATWRHIAAAELADTTAIGIAGYVPESIAFGQFATLNLPGVEANTRLGRRYDPHGAAPVTGCAVRLVTGPTAGGDTWTITARHDYPISRILPLVSASPRHGWRSTQDTNSEAIAWALPDTAANTVLSASGTLGLYLGAINFRSAQLWGWSGAAWTQLLVLDAAEGLTGLKYFRRGDTITVDTTQAQPAGAAWLQRDELAGGTFDLGGGIVRRILRNSSGRWQQTGAGPVLWLEGVDGTEPSTGTGHIWRPNVCGIVRSVARYRKLRLDMIAPIASGTVDGDLRIGVAVVGPYVPLAPYAWGRSLEDQPDVQIVELESGLRLSRVRGPPMRRVAVSWPEGFLTRELYQTAAVPEEFSGSRGAPSDTPGQLAGIIREIDGARTPVVLVAAMTGTQQHVADALHYGRITSPITREVITGSELADEIQRVNEIVLECER